LSALHSAEIEAGLDNSVQDALIVLVLSGLAKMRFKRARERLRPMKEVPKRAD